MALPDYDEKTLLVEAARLSPVEAVAYFRAKGFKINWNWRETLGNANNQVFQIAKATNLGVVQDIRSAMDAAISDGQTFKQFQKLIEPRLALRGWTGKKFLPNPKTGIPELVELGTPRRLETIYRTNMQSAFNAGRWEDQVLNSVNRPYLKLIEILDGATRTTHRQMSGSIKPVNSSFWNVWYPPNGFNNMAYGSLISTLKGEKRIEDVKIGDSVLTHTGNFKGVYETMKKIYGKDLYELELESGKTLKLSGDHPVLCARGWVYAEDLTENDEVFEVKHICQTCKKPLNEKQKRFCGLACLGVFNKKNKTVHRLCQHCGDEIPPRGKKKNKIYCSQKCLGEGQRKNKNACKNCGEIMLSNKKAGLNYSKDRLFCSRYCFVTYKGESSIETKVRQWLESNDFEFIQEAKTGKYKADFLLPLESVVIEADSEYWHRNTKEKDARRDFELLAEFGLLTIRLTDTEINNGDFSKLEILKDAESIKNKKNQESQVFRLCL